MLFEYKMLYFNKFVTIPTSLNGTQASRLSTILRSFSLKSTERELATGRLLFESPYARGRVELEKQLLKSSLACIARLQPVVVYKFDLSFRVVL